jgi:hypothetical protein
MVIINSYVYPRKSYYVNSTLSLYSTEANKMFPCLRSNAFNKATEAGVKLKQAHWVCDVSATVF